MEFYRILKSTAIEAVGLYIIIGVIPYFLLLENVKRCFFDMMFLVDCLYGISCLLSQTMNQIHSWFLVNVCVRMHLFNAGSGMAQFAKSLFEHVVGSA